MSYFSWRKYVPVRERRAKALKKMEKLKKKGVYIRPVEIEKRKIAKTFWGKAWCDHIESFSDYENRLPRGRTYVCNGSVCHLEVQKGLIKAMVYGSELYHINIKIKLLSDKKWGKIKSVCAGQIGSLLDLLSGKLSDNVMGIVCDRQEGLFPKQGEISFDCDCFDWADMCKHVAASLYGVGSRLDLNPEQLFLLRGVDHKELVDVSDAVTKVIRVKKPAHRHIGDSDISDIFGIDLSSEKNEKASVNKKLLTSAKKDFEKKTSRSTKKGVQEKTLSTKLRQKSVIRRDKRKRTDNKKDKKLDERPKKTKFAFPAYLTGADIQKIRKSLDIAKTAFAKKIGVSISTIYRWEGKSRKRINLQAQIAKKLSRIYKCLK